MNLLRVNKLASPNLQGVISGKSHENQQGPRNSGLSKTLPSKRIGLSGISGGKPEILPVSNLPGFALETFFGEEFVGFFLVLEDAGAELGDIRRG